MTPNGNARYTLGIEEEYLLVDAQTCALADVPDAF